MEQPPCTLSAALSRACVYVAHNGPNWRWTWSPERGSWTTTDAPVGKWDTHFFELMPDGSGQEMGEDCGGYPSAMQVWDGRPDQE